MQRHLSLLTGEQRSKGIELGLERQHQRRWQVSAGYAWQKAEITEATTACPAGDCEVPLVPRHSFSLWTRYDVLEAARPRPWRHRPFEVATPDQQPGEAARLRPGRRGAVLQDHDGVEAQLNVENIFGADYFPTAHNDNNIAPGAPMTVRGTIRFGL